MVIEKPISSIILFSVHLDPSLRSCTKENENNNKRMDPEDESIEDLEIEEQNND